MSSSNWLQSLPHQIPFRAASAARIIDSHTIHGTFLVSENDPLCREIMVVEAMAQLAGGLAFSSRKQHGLLTGIDDCEVRGPLLSGDVVELRVTLDAQFGSIFRFSGTATVDGVERGKGRFYLSEPDA